MKNLKKIFSVLLAAASCLVQAQAEAPSSYYKSCEGKSGKALLSSLEDVVGDPSVPSYKGLWQVFKSSDVRSDGTIWDMYSTSKFKPGNDQCGNYKTVGDCYNREHSFPKSWFDEGKPMYSDAFHLYPTDGYVNSKRSNMPYGECADGQYPAAKGSVKPLGKTGKSTYPGYSGTVFEPDDEYKGDFARSYFYMAAAYNSRIADWNSDMLAGNSYPAYKSWAVEMLLKWHRQDPVSKKELDRNEAVYREQGNRNPFIDYPELAEHVWGDKKTEGWKSTSESTPVINRPVDGSTVTLPQTIVGVASTATVSVLASDLKDDIKVAVSGQGYSVSSTTIAKAKAMAGAEITVTYTPEEQGTASGTLTLTSGSAKSTVKLSCQAIGTIPAGPVNTVGEESFVATWNYVGDDDGGKYTLDVRQGGQSVSGYPAKVDAKAGSYNVEGLEPSTAYTYTVASLHLTSDPVKVTTSAPVPLVSILFDGELYFTTSAGESSEAAELLMLVENITDDITLSATEPFQLSSDKSTWASQITVSSEEDRFYLRLFSDRPGTYNGSITVQAGEYFDDRTEFSGVVTATPSSAAFCEDFEADATDMGTYSNKTYVGSACTWKVEDAGMWGTDDVHGGSQAMRMGKSATSTIEMADDHAPGFGTVTLWVEKWSRDADVSYELEYSTDRGASWKSAGTGTVTLGEYVQQTFVLNVAGPARIRVRQTEGKRFLIDDIEATAPTSFYEGITKPDYHRWDAFARGAQLVIEAYEAVDARVYALDGTEVFNSSVAQGTLSLDLASGLYIVVVDDFARRVLVK